MSSGSFKNNVTYKLFAYKWLLNEWDLSLNNPEGLICHKTRQNDEQTKKIKNPLHQAQCFYIYSPSP